MEYFVVVFLVVAILAVLIAYVFLSTVGLLLMVKMIKYEERILMPFSVVMSIVGLLILV